MIRSEIVLGLPDYEIIELEIRGGGIRISARHIGLKTCPHCGRCLCEHPAYQEPHFWKDAPVVFQRHEFQRWFLHYL